MSTALRILLLIGAIVDAPVRCEVYPQVAYSNERCSGMDADRTLDRDIWDFPERSDVDRGHLRY